MQKPLIKYDPQYFLITHFDVFYLRKLKLHSL